MNSRLFKFVLSLSLVFSILISMGSCTHSSSFQNTQETDLSKFAFDSASFHSLWTVEAQNSELLFHNDTLEVVSQGGFTLWWNEKIYENQTVEYYACVMDEGQPFDRLSDLNCFWMATDPLYSDDIFVRSEWRNGDFGKYYSLNLYYVGYGGNENTTTRFRRYAGEYEAFKENRDRPDILIEYTDSQYLLVPNHWYHIRIVCQNNVTQYYIDDQLIVDFEDEQAYTSGWFGFRTVQSRVKLHGFKVS